MESASVLQTLSHGTITTVLAHRTGSVRLDNAFALIEGHPAAGNLCLGCFYDSGRLIYRIEGMLDAVCD